MKILDIDDQITDWNSSKAFSSNRWLSVFSLRSKSLKILLKIFRSDELGNQIKLYLELFHWFHILSFRSFIRSHRWNCDLKKKTRIRQVFCLHLYSFPSTNDIYFDLKIKNKVFDISKTSFFTWWWFSDQWKIIFVLNGNWTTKVLNLSVRIFFFISIFNSTLIAMDQESAMMIYLSYQKLRMPTFSKLNWLSKLQSLCFFFFVHRCSTTTNRESIARTFTGQKIYFTTRKLFSTATIPNDDHWTWTHGNRSSKAKEKNPF